MLVEQVHTKFDIYQYLDFPQINKIVLQILHVPQFTESELTLLLTCARFIDLAGIKPSRYLTLTLNDYQLFLTLIKRIN